MPDAIARSTSGIFVSVKISQESRNRGKEFLEIGNRQSTFGNSESGGIAQLVERQLCKLEVRGSNPLASTIQRSEITKLSGDENLVRPVGRGAQG